MRRCTTCKTDKPFAEFYQDHRNRCKPCTLATVTAWQKSDPERCKRMKRESYARNKDTPRNYILKKWYGISLADYKAMLSAQGDSCACCGTKTPGKKPFAVDHCHKSGAVRALLCTNCNAGLGLFKDNIERLLQAVAYLRKFQKKEAA